MQKRVERFLGKFGIGQCATFEWDAPVDRVFWINATRWAFRVIGITAWVDTQGTDGSAVTAVIKKTDSGTDIASGTALHSGTINLKGTVDTKQELTLSTTVGALIIAPDVAIGIDVSGTTTAAVGHVTVAMIPTSSG